MTQIEQIAIQCLGLQELPENITISKQQLLEICESYRRSYKNQIVTDCPDQLKHIISIVGTHYDIDFTVVERHRKYVIPRQVYCYLAYHYTNQSLSVIGKAIEKNHATVLHARKRIVHCITMVNNRYPDIEIFKAVKHFDSILKSEGYIYFVGERNK
jgi:chromosomal replication initiation ATPase DnaA